MRNKKSIGLKGGPNEFLKDITQHISVDGYKRYSKDLNNPYNVIESGNITMEDVDFPVMGTDNLGNSQMMMPGMNYQFPGDQVFEVPMVQDGGNPFTKDTNKYTIDGGMLPEVNINSLSKESYEKLNDEEKYIYDLYTDQDGNFKQTIPFQGNDGITADIGYEDMLRMLKDSATDINFKPRWSTFLNKDRYNIKDGQTDFRAHAVKNMLPGMDSDIYIPPVAEMEEYLRLPDEERLDNKYGLTAEQMRGILWKPWIRNNLSKNNWKSTDDYNVGQGEGYTEGTMMTDRDIYDAVTDYRFGDKEKYPDDDFDWDNDELQNILIGFMQENYGRRSDDPAYREEADVYRNNNLSKFTGKLIAELAHTNKDIRTGFGDWLRTTGSRIGRAFEEGSYPDRSNYHDPTDSEYQTHYGPNSRELQLLRKYLTSPSSSISVPPYAEKEDIEDELSENSSGDFYVKSKGGSTTWTWKGKSYSGTLIPSMETETNRYARTKNGKVKTLPKGQDGTEIPDEAAVPDNSFLYELEKLVNASLGDINNRAKDFSENPDEMANIDNMRHATGGRYAAEAIQQKVRDIPYVGGLLDSVGADKVAGFIGSNVLGIGHELRTMLGGDDRPFLKKLQEMGEDSFNNLIGSVVGSLDIDDSKKDEVIRYLSYNNLLPDGYVGTQEGIAEGLSDNVYFKDTDGNVRRPDYRTGGSLPQAQIGEETEDDAINMSSPEVLDEVVITGTKNKRDTWFRDTDNDGNQVSRFLNIGKGKKMTQEELYADNGIFSRGMPQHMRTPTDMNPLVGESVEKLESVGINPNPQTQAEYEDAIDKYNLSFGTDYSYGNASNEYSYETSYKPQYDEMIAKSNEMKLNVGLAAMSPLMAIGALEFGVPALAYTGEATYGAVSPYVSAVLNQPLAAAFGATSGPTVMQGVNSAFAADFLGRRAPRMVDDFSEGRIMDGTVEAGFGLLDLWGAGVFNGSTKIAKSLISKLPTFTNELKQAGRSKFLDIPADDLARLSKDELKLFNELNSYGKLRAKSGQGLQPNTAEDFIATIDNMNKQSFSNATYSEVFGGNSMDEILDVYNKVKDNPETWLELSAKLRNPNLKSGFNLNRRSRDNIRSNGSNPNMNDASNQELYPYSYNDGTRDLQALQPSELPELARQLGISVDELVRSGNLRTTNNSTPTSSMTQDDLIAIQQRWSDRFGASVNDLDLQQVRRYYQNNRSGTGGLPANTPEGNYSLIDDPEMTAMREQMVYGNNTSGIEAANAMSLNPDAINIIRRTLDEGIETTQGTYMYTSKDLLLEKIVNTVQPKVWKELIKNPTKLKKYVFSNYPMHIGPVQEKVGNLQMGNQGGRGVKAVIDNATNLKKPGSFNTKSGDVITGSTNTSHNSYMTQLRSVFGNPSKSGNIGGQGQPVFIDYKPMNSMGFLSKMGKNNDEILKYLNTSIDNDIKRGRIILRDNQQIQRPYILKSKDITNSRGSVIMLPHYGVKLFKEGGSLSSYQDKGEVKKTYNAFTDLDKVSQDRRTELTNAINFVVDDQGGDENLRDLLTMTAYMENSFGADSTAYDREYTRGPMSIDDVAFKHMFEKRKGANDFSKGQKKYIEWFKGMGYDLENMDNYLRNDIKANVAASRYQYGTNKAPLPSSKDPQALYDYYMNTYNRTGKDHYDRFLQGYNELIGTKKFGGSSDKYLEYKKFINGGYTGNENTKAEKNYDKLNRIHYKEAKELGLSPQNYIMTNILGNS